ncbi:hypothetical protein [Kitasatospora sp. NPDC057015]|uniref:hypothetical protein n=1 Tax=Kitasatospora sp. NPDC057015 TaxID=3346001 RepID=UPI00363802DC
MPGQGKRRRQRSELRERAAAAWAAEAERPGHWEVVFETRDESDWSNQLPTRIRRLRAERGVTDERLIRVDVLCGRTVQPTTYRLSLFVPADAVPPSAEAPPHP